MEFFTAYLTGLLAIFVMMTVLWLISLIVKDSSIVDIFWGFGFVVAAVTYFLITPDGFQTRKVLITALTAIWGLRLTLHIGYRNIGKGEDFRYVNWRNQFGARWWWLSYVRVFLLQGVIMWIVSIPLLAAQWNATPDSLTFADYIAVVVWAIGFVFEAGGDWQLMRFKRNPANKGKLLSSGFWRYTRHPNYFGDAAQWWGLWLVALAAGGWWTVFSPAIMTFLLVRVSGVAMLEKSLAETKPQYREYIKNTPAFFPWLPKKNG
jgi:steroid 5-alpha reductase family enzyme